MAMKCGSAFLKKEDLFMFAFIYSTAKLIKNIITNQSLFINSGLIQKVQIQASPSFVLSTADKGLRISKNKIYFSILCALAP